MSKLRIVFRADGNSSIGLGHVYRLLSLVDICKETFDCLFITADPDPSLSAVINTYCKLLAISKNNEWEVLRKELHPSDIVVLDGNHFDANYQQSARSMVHKLVMIDDTAESHLYADLVINHGGELLIDQYSTEPYCKLLLGFPYLLLRSEFLAAAKREKRVEKVDTVFICMGGADPFNVTIKAIKACLDVDFIKKVIVVTGSAFQNKMQLEEVIVSGRTNKDILHEQNVSAERMVELIMKSELAICPSSSIAMEVCCVKAALVTGTVIGNQAAIHQQLIHHGCAVSVGDLKAISLNELKSEIISIGEKEIMKSMVKNQRTMFDGNSGHRLLKELNTIAFKN